MIEGLLDFTHFVFGVPHNWLVFPDVIFYFFIPLGLLIAIYAVLLEKAIKVLPTGGNIGLAIVVGIISSRIAVLTSGVFGMVGGIVVLGAVLAGLCALFYRFTIDALIITLWIALIVLWLGGFFGVWQEFIDLSLIFVTFGFFGIIALFGCVLKITKVRILVMVVILLIITIILPFIIGIIRGY